MNESPRQIFTGSNTVILLDTKVDISVALQAWIGYKKPDGTMGQFPATVVDNTKVRYETSVEDLDQTKTWEFQAIVNLSGNILKGGIHRVYIYSPIDVNLN